MAWRNSGVLIRQLLGKRSNPCRCAGLLHHQHRNLSSSNFIQTQTLTQNSSPSSPQTIDSLHSPIHLHPLQHQRRLSSVPPPLPAPAPAAAPATGVAAPATGAAAPATGAAASASGITISSPTSMLNITTKTEYKSAIKQVKDGRFPAVFCFIDPNYPPNLIRISPIVRKLREKFPHVTIYKILVLQVCLVNMCYKMNIDYTMEPIFHLYQNGKKADETCEAKTDRLIDTFGKLYRYVLPVETTQPTRSSVMGKRRTQQLVVDDKKGKDGNGVKGGGAVLSQWRGVATESQCRGVATLSQQSSPLARAVESSTAPSLDQVMHAVFSQWRGVPTSSGQSRRLARAAESSTIPSLVHVMDIVRYEIGEDIGGELWWFAFGLFKSQPEKRVMFSEMMGGRFPKVIWLFDQMAQE